MRKKERERKKRNTERTGEDLAVQLGDRKLQEVERRLVMDREKRRNGRKRSKRKEL